MQHMAILNRQLRFLESAIIQISSMSFSVITGIIMGLYGWGYWSLVGMTVAFQIGYVTLSWFFCKWRPSMPVRRAGTRPLLRFGGHLTGFNIVNYFARNFDNILIGRFCGPTPLGFYSKAYSLMMLPITQIRTPLHKVSIPVLSRLQDDPARFRRYYMKLLSLIAFVTMPLMTFMVISAEKVILMVLGDQWGGAVSIFRVLCVNAFIQPVAGTLGLVFISLGMSKRYFTIGSINSGIIIASFALGLPWGAIGVSISYTIVTYFVLVPNLWYCYKGSPISISDFFSAIYQPAIASGAMGASLLSVRPYLMASGNVISLMIMLLIGTAFYLFILSILPGGYQFLKEFLSYRSLLFQKH